MNNKNGFAFDASDLFDQVLRADDEKMLELINELGGSTFKYMMRRINRLILKNNDYQKMDINEFFLIFIETLSMINTNAIRWMEDFYKIKTNREYPEKKLQVALIQTISNQLTILGR